MRTDIELSIKPMFVTTDKSGPIYTIIPRDDQNLRGLFMCSCVLFGISN